MQIHSTPSGRGQAFIFKNTDLGPLTFAIVTVHGAESMTPEANACTRVPFYK